MKRRGITSMEKMDKNVAPVRAAVASDQYWRLRREIEELFKESDTAKRQGQWKKAQDLLFEAWKKAKNGIETEVL
jgi:hypothetical protein